MQPSGWGVPVFLLAVLLTLAAPAEAQLGTTGMGDGFSISGRVMIEPGIQPLDMAMVSLRTFSGMTVSTTSSGSQGEFSFHGLNRGVYYVHASKFGFGENSERIELVNSSHVGLHIVLSRLLDSKPVLPEAVSIEHLNIPGKARKEYLAGQRKFREKGDFSGALAHFQKAVEIYPEFAAAYYWMGLMHIDLEQEAEARTALIRAVEIDDKLGAAYFPLGAMHLHFREYALAEESLKQGLASYPGFWRANYELGIACFAQEKLECAEEAATRAEKLNPQFPRTLLLLAKIYLAQGKEELAITHAEKFLAIAGDDPMRADVQKTLTELQAAKLPRP